MRRSLCLVLPLLMLAAPPFRGAEAEASPVSVGGKVRLRVENWENFGFRADQDDDFLLYRAFLNARLRLAPGASVFVEGKHAEADGRDLPGGNRAIDTDSLDLHQAYADLSFALAEGQRLELRPGRQELQFGKQRLISPLDWVNTRRSFDGVRAAWADTEGRVDAFATRLVRSDKREFNDGDSGEDFHGLYATRRLSPTLSGDLYALWLDRESAQFGSATNREERLTLGGRLWGAPAETALDYDVEVAGQGGDFGDQDIRAWMAAAEVGVTAADFPGRPRFHLAYDYASGDADAADGDVETFNQLYPLGHAYFGFADLVGRQNIRAASGGLTAHPAPQLTLKVDFHWFNLAESGDALYNAGGGVARAGGDHGNTVGRELDLLLRYAPTDGLVLLAGFSRFFTEEFVQRSGPSEDVDFGYASVEFTF
jgi:hypothetical protein